MSRNYCIHCDRIPSFLRSGKSVFLEFSADSIISATRHANKFCDINKGDWYIKKIYIDYKKRNRGE